MPGYTDPFGGSSVQPAEVSYRAVALSANTTLGWPSVESTNYVARIMDVTASAGSLALTMPDATAVSPGYDVIFLNPGAQTYTVKDNAGGTIVAVAPGAAQYIYLRTNATAAGTWGVLQFASLASAVSAAALAGAGLQANGSQLQVAEPVTTFSVSRTLATTDLSQVLVWTGGSGTLTVLAATTAGANFFVSVANQGTGTLTLARSGADTIDGATSLQLQAGESLVLHSGGGTAWYTVGRGRSTQFNFTLLTKAISTGTVTLSNTEAANTVQIYTGALVGNVNVVVPSTVQVYYVSNQTTGAFSVTFKTAGVGTTVTVPTGQNAVLFCDGTNVLNSSTTVSGISSLSLSVGSAGSPSISFVSDGTTGIFSPGTGRTGLSSGGTMRFEAMSTGAYVYGNAGAYSVRVADSAGAGDRIRMLAGTAGNGATIDVCDNGETTTARPLTLGASNGAVYLGSSAQFQKDAAGLVGIGVTPSSAQLHVKSSLLHVAKIETSVARGSGQIVFSLYDPTGLKAYFGYGAANDKLLVHQALNESLDFYTNSSFRWRIQNDGQLVPSADATFNIGASALEVASFLGRNLERISAGDLTVNASNAGGAVAIRVAGAESARLTTTGMGLGSITPTERLDVFGNAGRFRDASYSGYLGKGSALLVGGAASDFAVYASAGNLLFGTGANVLRMVIDSSGNIGVGGVASGGYNFDLGTSGRTIGGVGNIGGYSDAGAYSIYAGRSSVNGGYIQLYGGSHATTPNLLLLGTNGATRVVVDASGQVGVGVTPTSLFDVSKAATTIKARFRAGAGLASIVSICGNNTTAEVSSLDLQQDSAGNADIVQRNNARLSLYANNAEVLRLTATGLIQDAAGNELGFKGLPSASVTTGAFAAADRGKCVFATAGVTVPNSTMSAGDVVIIQNTTSSNQTITATITTLRQTGTTNTGNRTLLPYGRASIVFASGTEAYISGDVT